MYPIKITSTKVMSVCVVNLAVTRGGGERWEVAGDTATNTKRNDEQDKAPRS